jgi:hypothetical protein
LEKVIAFPFVKKGYFYAVNARNLDSPVGNLRCGRCQIFKVASESNEIHLVMYFIACQHTMRDNSSITALGEKLPHDRRLRGSVDLLRDCRAGARG